MSATSHRKPPRRLLGNDEDTQDFIIHARPPRQRRSVPEEGLSVDADELGERFLSDATEQGNFESQLPPQLSLMGGADTDEALVNDDPDGGSTVWDHTIRRARSSDVREIIDVAVVEDRGVDPDSPDDPDQDHGPRTVDVRQGRVVGASLFDDEADELGETRSPDVRADDQRRRAS